MDLLRAIILANETRLPVLYCFVFVPENDVFSFFSFLSFYLLSIWGWILFLLCFDPVYEYVVVLCCHRVHVNNMRMHIHMSMPIYKKKREGGGLRSKYGLCLALGMNKDAYILY